MFIVFTVLLIFCIEVDGLGTDFHYSRIRRRRFSQDRPMPTLNITGSNGPDLPLVAVQVVDAHGLVIDRVSTNQMIRLRVQALTTADFQAPFVKKCWYGLHASYPIDPNDAQGQVVFLNDGCGDDSILLKTSELSLHVNGPLEVHTSLFNLMPLFNKQFSVMDIHCETSLCRIDATCRVDCSKGRARVWKMDRASQIVEASVSVKVDKRRHIQPTATTMLPNLDDFLIRGGRKHSVYAHRTVKPPFLKRYQPYVSIVTMCVVLLLLAFMIGIGYMFVLYKNKRKFAAGIEDLPPDHVTGCHDNKITDFPNYAGTSHGGLHGSGDHVISPPPAYNKAGFLSTSDAKAKSPYREKLTANEAPLLETRLMSRNPLHPETRLMSRNPLHPETRLMSRNPLHPETRLMSRNPLHPETRLMSRNPLHPVTRSQSLQKQLYVETEHRDRDRLTASDAAMLEARMQSRSPVHPVTRSQSVQRQLDLETEHRDQDRLTASEAAMLEARMQSRGPVHPVTRSQSVQRQLDLETEHRDRDRLTASEVAMLEARMLSRSPVTRHPSVHRQLDQESERGEQDRLTANETALLDARLLSRASVHPITRSQSVHRQLDLESEHGDRDRLTVSEASLVDARLLSRIPVHSVTRPQPIQRQMDRESVHRDRDRLTESEAALWEPRHQSRNPVHLVTRHQSVQRQPEYESEYGDRDRLTASEAALWEPRHQSRNPLHPVTRHQSVQRPLDQESEQGDISVVLTDASIFRADTAEHDHGGGRLQRGQITPWIEPLENFRELADTGPTPVGGEWYTGRTGRNRSSSTDQLIQTSQGRASLIQTALKDYFNKYGM